MKLRILLIFNLVVFLTIISQTYGQLDLPQLSLQCKKINVTSATVVGSATLPVVYIGCQQNVSLESLGNSSANATINEFLGIPFAQPPIGDLRFAKPACYVPTPNQTIDATSFKPSCLQPPLSSETNDIIDQNENCLYLNIWTPTTDSNANLPVMFYIPGGAFLWGSGRKYVGSILATRQFVVITINYRLGAFGFLSGNQSDAPGNQGLWDQILALNWTTQHVKDFGGNPKNITVFAQSSGAMSLSYLVLSDVSKDMFQKAILQSGSGIQKLFSNDKASATALAKKFSVAIGCNNINVNWITCMRSLPAADILISQSVALGWNFWGKPWYSAYLLQFVPIYGDELMPDTLNNSIAAGKFPTDMPVLIGHTEMEGELFAYEFDIVKALGFIYQGPLNDSILAINKCKVYSDIKNSFIDEPSFGALVAANYTAGFSDTGLLNLLPNLLDPTNRNRLRGSAVHALGDFLLTCPAILFGNYLAKKNITVYQYKLTYINKQSQCYQSGWCNSTHADDIPLVFGFPFQSPSNYTEDDKRASILLMNIWTQFAANGTVPQVNGYDWPPYSVINGVTNLKYMVLDIDPNKVKVVENGYDGVGEYTPSCINNCKNFWDSILFGMF